MHRRLLKALLKALLRSLPVTGCCWELRSRRLHAAFVERGGTLQWLRFEAGEALPLEGFPLFRLLPGKERRKCSRSP